MRKILSLSVIDVQILPLSSNGRKEIMEALKEILIKNEWFTKQEVEETFTPYVVKCIDECTRPKQDEIFNAFDGLKPQDVKEKHYWVLSAGEKAKLWEDFKENSIIAIGWDDWKLGDLKEYNDRQNLADKIATIDNQTSNKNR